MSYVTRYSNGTVHHRRLGLAGLGDGEPQGVPPYVTAIIQQIEAQYPLNTQTTQALMTAFGNALSEEAKSEAVKRAAVAAGLSIADIILMMTGVGAIVAVLVTVVMAIINAGLKITQTYFANQANAIVADTENYLRTLVAQYNAKLVAYQGQVVEEEAPAAYQLAVSGQQLHGLGAWQDSLARDMRRAVTATALVTQPILQLHHVTAQALLNPITKLPVPVIANTARATAGAEADAYSDIQRYEKNVDDFIKVGTGEAQLEKTQEAAAKVRAAGEIELKKQFDIAMANSNSPPFRQSLRTGLAAIFRTDPTINSIMSQVVASVANGQAQQLNVPVQQPSAGLQAVPMVATALAAGATLLFLKK